MNLRKWSNVLKIILLKIVEEIELRLKAKDGEGVTSNFTSSLYTSLKFIVLEQVDLLVDETVKYSKTLFEEFISKKISEIISSIVTILVIIGMIFFAVIFFAIGFSIFMGEILGNTYYGFLLTGGILLLLSFIMYTVGHQALSNKIKKHLKDQM